MHERFSPFEEGPGTPPSDSPGPNSFLVKVLMSKLLCCRPDCQSCFICCYSETMGAVPVSCSLTAASVLMQEELMEVVDFFLKPQRFRRSGAKIPRGVLLCGPPGLVLPCHDSNKL